MAWASLNRLTDMQRRHMSSEERDSLLHTLYTTRTHVEKRIAKHKKDIRDAAALLESDEAQLSDIEQSIYWLREE